MCVIALHKQGLCRIEACESYFFLFTITSSGEARNMDEYVPKNIPAVIIIANTFVVAGPKNTRARSTMITVEDVAIERV